MSFLDTQIITWTRTHGEESLLKHAHLADNLKSIKTQQKEFEKFYFSAMKNRMMLLGVYCAKMDDIKHIKFRCYERTHIDKGNDLLEEASMLAQSGNFNELADFKEMTFGLKKHLQMFTSRLEETRERLESTTKCYHLLDKTYEWALEAMKYVASMKMEHCGTPEGLEKLLRSLELYLRDHPVMKEETFISMIGLARKLQNDRLIEQCSLAKSRCEETQKLLILRQTTLRRAREQMIHEQGVQCFSPKHRTTDFVKHDRDITSVSSSSLCSDVVIDRSVVKPRSYSTPEGMECSPQRRSVDSPKPVVRTSNTHHLEQYGLDKTPQNKTGLYGIDDENSVRTDDRSGDRTYARSDVGIGDRTEIRIGDFGDAIPKEEDQTCDKNVSPSRKNKDGRTNSMITGSTDSLPSLPEELEEGDDQRPTSPQLTSTPVPVNTHLSIQNRTIPDDSLPDVKLNGTDKSRRTLAHIMREMIQTERDYVYSLQYIIDHFIPELQRQDVPQALRGKSNVIFGNIEKIYQFHRQYFLTEVEMCERSPFQIAHYFIMHSLMNFDFCGFFCIHESQFYLYALYNKNKPRSDNLMAEYGKYFFRDKQLRLGDKMDLSSYLLKPVQRMGKYALLLKQMMKECPRSQQEYQDLKAAEQMVRFQLRHGNDLLAMDSLRECDVNLQEQGRLIRQDEFLVWQGRKKSMRHLFLFEDLVLFSKTYRGRNGGSDTYVYKYSLKASMSDIGLTADYGESGYKFELWFRKRSIGENYVLQAPSSEVKSVWHFSSMLCSSDIFPFLWISIMSFLFLTFVTEHRLTEMATMGIGNKPSLDIQPSADNIQDRFVNVNIGNRGEQKSVCWQNFLQRDLEGVRSIETTTIYEEIKLQSMHMYFHARTRNSIAVSSLEHYKDNYKRPHSIISVSSSNSSSNSSHSGVQGHRNLSSSHDASRFYGKSGATFLSNESGIGTDVSSGPEMDMSGRNVRHSPSRSVNRTAIDLFNSSRNSNYITEKF
ncbi:hypothetical protein KUTeg_018992 [Tegillarca granosa]|uniref:Uncharacterized protein n=1 Tax=Tegillarca granosa TaxID=220873 RepID=A0ABQ9EDU9_TEGGR|nr:hypothetical protein KUTeg_018992 [Tegillarca granosa]